jgi:PAS domain S-box-containing protein
MMDRSAKPSPTGDARVQAARDFLLSTLTADLNRNARLLRNLYRRIEELEKEGDSRRNLQEALYELESRYQSLVENIPDVIYSLDQTGNILTINKAVLAYGYTQEELIGKHFIEFIHPDDCDWAIDLYLGVVAARKSHTRTRPFRIFTRSREIRWLEASYFIRYDAQGQFIRHEGACHDITESVQHQTSLIQVREELEKQVRIRTRELLEANLELQREIEDRRATEKALREREAELVTEKANLQEANTALKVLLKRREVDKKELEEQIQSNIKQLVLPYLQKVLKQSADEGIHAYLGIIESNLREITCGFSRRLSLEFYSLSAAELKIANFIRQGKKSREIADLLNISIRTVEASRQSVRRKLRLDKQKVNLRTFLMSIE